MANRPHQCVLLERVRAHCARDAALRAALMYGSFAEGRGDAYSDIEFVLFFRDEDLASLDRRAWIAEIEPVELMLENEFGVTDAIFRSLVRGEFHFDPVSRMGQIAAAWPGIVAFPSIEAALVVDKDGELAPLLGHVVGPPPTLAYAADPTRAQEVAARFLNWIVFAWWVWRRGEWARALELLAMVQRHLLLLARLRYASTGHWHIPSRSLESDLPSDAYARYAACSAILDRHALRDAISASWRWGRELLGALHDTLGICVSAHLLEAMDAHMAHESLYCGRENG